MQITDEPIFRNVADVLRWSFSVLATEVGGANIFSQFMPGRSSSRDMGGAWDRHAQAGIVLGSVERMHEHYGYAMVLAHGDRLARERAADKLAPRIAATMGTGLHRRRAIQLALLHVTRTPGYKLATVADALECGRWKARKFSKKVMQIYGYYRDQAEDTLREQLGSGLIK